MILANRRVAELLVEHRRPALHRVHEPPDAGSIAVLLEQLEELGVPTPPAPALHGGPETARYAGLLSGAVMRYAVREGRGVEAWPGMMLRAVRKARYDPAPLGHSGLAARHYCHFTSPIRRYPDLVCHRALLGCAGPRRRRAAERGPGGSRRALLRGGARRRAPRAPRHRDLPGVPARAPALRPGLGRAVRGRGGRPDRGRSVRPLRRGVRGVHARAALAGRAGDARPARREHGGAERAAAPARRRRDGRSRVHRPGARSDRGARTRTAHDAQSDDGESAGRGGGSSARSL